MADKTSLHGNYPEASDALRKFIESVAKNILLDGKKLTDYQGTLKMYLESEGIDYNSWEHSMNMFLATMIAYRDNPTQALFDVAKLPARRCFVSTRTMGYLASQLKKTKKTQPRHEENQPKPATWKYMGYGFIDGFFTFTIINPNNNWVSVKSANNVCPSTLEIPSKVSYLGQSFEVVAIGDYAFQNHSFQKVIVPDSILRIGEYAFVRCGYLKTIKLPKNITEIGKCAFAGCGSLSEVSLPNSLACIPESCFQNCALNTIDIPQSVVQINGGAFMGCHLQRIVIPNSVTIIGSGAFNGCKLQNVAIPDSVTDIGMQAFMNNKELKKVILPKSIKYIQTQLFSCDSMLEEINIPNSVEHIGVAAFSYCNLKTLNIPQGVTYIGENAFYGNPNLQSVTLPSSIKNIPSGAFGECKKLETVYLHPKTYYYREGQGYTPSFDKKTKIVYLKS